MNKIIKSVAIFGSADIDQNTPLYQSAFDVARSLAENGYKVVNGGGPGVMEAATQGAESASGETLTVSFIPKDATFFEAASSDNKADVDIRVNNYVKRLNGLVNHSDAFIIFQGGTGTLSEWAMVWLLAHIYYGHHKPFILYGAFWNEVMDVIIRNFFIGDLEKLTYRVVTSPQEVLTVLQEFDVILQHLKTQSPQVIREEHKSLESSYQEDNNLKMDGHFVPAPFPTLPEVTEPSFSSEPRLSLEGFVKNIDTFDTKVDSVIHRLRAMLDQVKEQEPDDFFDRAVPIPTPIIDLPPPPQSGAHPVFSAADIDLMELMPPRSAPYGEPNV